MATSRRVGNYSTSAKAVVRASDQIFDAAMSGKPDFTKISETAMKGRSLLRRTAAKAEAKVASAGLDAFDRVNRTQMDVDTKKKVADIKRGARRMAGVVGGLGSIMGAVALNKSNKEVFKEKIGGMDPGAPKNPKIGKKFLITTLITTIIFVVIYYLVEIDLLNLREFLQ